MSNTAQPHFKTLYEFTVEVMREIETEITRQEGEKTVIEKTRVKEPVPAHFAFKKPSREERETADEYRVRQVGAFIEKGFIPEALLIKRYANSGGILNDVESNNAAELQVMLLDKLREYQLYTTEKDTEKAKAASLEAMKLRDKIIDIQRSKDAFFEHTAEARGRNKLSQYLVLMFTFTRNSVEDAWEPYFKGATVEDRFKSLDEFEENDDETFLKVWNRMFLMASLYVSQGGAVSKDDITAFQKEFFLEENSSVSTPASTPPADGKSA